MSANPLPQLPPIGSLVTTVCGSDVKFIFDMPYSTYRGRLVSFCLPACKEDFDREHYASRFTVRLARGEGDM